jgi:hypothetical protein
MARYRHYVEVDAEQWTGRNPTAIRSFTGEHIPERGRPHPVFIVEKNGHGMLYIERINRWVSLSKGDYIVKEEVGFDRYNPNDFRHLFEKV